VTGYVALSIPSVVVVFAVRRADFSAVSLLVIVILLPAAALSVVTPFSRCVCMARFFGSILGAVAWLYHVPLGLA